MTTCPIRHAAAFVLVAALATAAPPARAQAPAAPPRLESTRALAAHLARGERARAAVTLESRDPLEGGLERHAGTLTLESPHYARLDFTGTGEALALRDDGGDWLQPELRQLLRGGAASAGAALEWSGVLREDAGSRYRERRVAARTFDLTPIEGGDTTRVVLAADGLPARIEFADPDGARRVVRLSRWRFDKARGRAGYVLEAPAGYEIVDLP